MPIILGDPMIIAAQRRRIQIVIKPVKVRVNTRLKANGLHTIAKSLRNLRELILAEIRILQYIVILKIVINGKRRMMAGKPGKCSVGIPISIFYRTGIGVVIDTVRNPKALTCSSVFFKGVIYVSVYWTDLKNGKINPRGLNLIPINSSLMIADVDAARNSAIGQRIVS